jgi:hypothetical protein
LTYGRTQEYSAADAGVLEMNSTIRTVVFWLLIAGSAYLLWQTVKGRNPALVAENAGQKDAEAYIIESERQWAESVANGDSGVVERILADDFVGVES